MVNMAENNKLIICETNQHLLKYVGLQFSYAEKQPWYYWCRYLLFVAETSIIYPMTTPLIINIHNVQKICNILILYGGLCSVMTKIVFFIIGAEKLTKLLQRLQDNIDFRMIEYRGKRYIFVNRIISLLVKIIMLSMAGVVLGQVLVPLFIFTHQYILGQLRREHYRYCIELQLPFDDTNILVFALVSFWTALMLGAGGSAHSGINTLFIGLTMNAVACFKDLADRFQDIDSNSEFGKNEKDQRARSAPIHLRQRKSKLELNIKILKCIELHIQYFDYIPMIEDIYGPIIFFQIFYSPIQMCTWLFDVTLNEMTTLSQIIPNIFLCIIILTELLVFCFFGYEVTYQGTEISAAIYECHWYTYPVEFQRFLCFAIQRSQKPIEIVGLKMVRAHLSTYTAIWNLVGSFYCLLQSFIQ